MHHLLSGQGIVRAVELHLPSAPLAWRGTREHPLAPSSAAGQGWKHRRDDGEDVRGVLQLIPPIPGWGHPALGASEWVVASEPGKGIKRG